MRKILTIFIVVAALMSMSSCDQHIPEAGFKDMISESILDYLIENKDEHSMFLRILEEGRLDKTMSAYNPNGSFYTMFLPTNEAIERFIEQSSLFSSFDALLDDKDYVAAMARYHVVDMAIETYDFPFGALPELNLSGQYLTVGFEVGTDSSYYKINNTAPLVQGNIELSNGFIHVISEALIPITFTSYQWLKQNAGYSIFLEAVEKTGYDEVLNRIIYRDSIGVNPVTLLIEPDTLYNRYGIYNFNDLVNFLEPLDNDYTNSYNAVNNFVGYHILEGSLFLSNFENVNSNYNTFGDTPVDINGEEIDLLINRNKIVTDSSYIVTGNDSVIVYEYLEITFYYDLSNNLTQSGAVHVINELLTVQSARARTVNFEFYEEPLFASYRDQSGEYLVDDLSLLNTISVTGGNERLYFVMNDVESEQAWNKDYIMLEGDFSVTYTLPRIVPGTYDLQLQAHAYDSNNALVEVFLDGVKIGGIVDLTSLGSNDYPYNTITLGRITLSSYEQHNITVRTLIPGVFKWDAVRFLVPLF
jgi:uncharacterized surface protein with fasciclin (FAS1) repeats